MKIKHLVLQKWWRQKNPTFKIQSEIQSWIKVFTQAYYNLEKLSHDVSQYRRIHH